MITDEIKEETERLLSRGMSGYAVSRHLGIAESTLSYNIRQGRIQVTKPQPKSNAKGTEPKTAESKTVMLDRSARDRRDRTAPIGRGARDSNGRQAASVGLMREAIPCFEEPLSAVANGGVLTALFGSSFSQRRPVFMPSQCQPLAR